MQIDPVAIFTTAGLWIADHFLFDVLVKAFGMSLLITTLATWLSNKLARWRDRISFGAIVLAIGVISISSFGYREPKPYLYFEPGVLFTGNGQVKIKIGDKEESLEPSQQLNIRRALTPGIPFEGFVEFRIADAPISIFSNPADYTITIIDSYGNHYVVKATTHGGLDVNIH